MGVIALAAGPLGCSEEVTRNVVATVLFVEGPALVSTNGGREFLPLLQGSRPGKGKIIETDASSRAALALLPNILIQLGQDTRIEIVRISVAKDGNRMAGAMRGRYAEMKLLRGRTFVSHDWGEAPAQFTLGTPQGILVTSSNTLFCVQSDGQRTRVTCAAGTVRFRPNAVTVATPIPAGYLGEWSKEASTIVAADTDAAGQADLEEALEVEQKLRSLREGLRNFPPGR